MPTNPAFPARDGYRGATCRGTDDVRARKANEREAKMHHLFEPNPDSRMVLSLHRRRNVRGSIDFINLCGLKKTCGVPVVYAGREKQFE